MCLTETAITIKKTLLCALMVLAILSVLFTPAMLSAQILETEFIARLVDLAPVLNTRDRRSARSTYAATLGQPIRLMDGISNAPTMGRAVGHAHLHTLPVAFRS